MIKTSDIVEAVLETKRLVLEPLRRSHASELFEILADERLHRFIPTDPPVSIEALARRFEQLETRGPPSGKELWLNWALRLRASGSCAGRVEATLRQDRSALLAYELGVPYWGQGLATEACRHVIETLFSDFGAEVIFADVDTRNAASIRLLDRLGFERGALTRGADVFKGSVSDELRFTWRRPAAGSGRNQTIERANVRTDVPAGRES